jgi:hypothetical protein
MPMSAKCGELPQGDQRFLGRFVSTSFLKRIGVEQSFHMAGLRSRDWSAWSLRVSGHGPVAFRCGS